MTLSTPGGYNPTGSGRHRINPEVERDKAVLSGGAERRSEILQNLLPGGILLECLLNLYYLRRHFQYEQPAEDTVGCRPALTGRLHKTVALQDRHELLPVGHLEFIHPFRRHPERQPSQRRFSTPTLSTSQCQNDANKGNRQEQYYGIVEHPAKHHQSPIQTRFYPTTSAIS